MNKFHEIDKRVLIRVDASAQMGAGHLIRMLALGQLLYDSGYEVHVATIPYDLKVLDHLRRESFQLHCLDQDILWDVSKDAEKLLNLAAEIQPSWVVLDGYHFDSDYEHKIKQAGFKLLRIDDVPSRHYYADVLLNQNYGAERMTYSTESNTKILSGLNYVLLRREFRHINSFDKNVEKNRPVHILISLGGASQITNALNIKIAQGLTSIYEKDLSATLIVGKIGEKIIDIERIVKNASWPIEIKEESQNMAQEMLKADLAIVSGGSTMWELMYMRVPFLAISLTEAQRDYLPLLAKSDLCINLGWREDLTQELAGKSVLDIIKNNFYRAQMIENVGCSIDRNNIGRDLLEVLDEKT